MTSQFLRRLTQKKTVLRAGIPVQGCISTQQISPCQGNTETWPVGKQAQKANDSPRVTSRSVVQQETGAALLSINQRHFLAAAKNATLKHWELWKVFGLTVQLGTNFVTFQNSKWMSLVKKHWTASGEKQDVFLQDLVKSSCGFCDRIRAAVRAETQHCDKQERELHWRPAPGSAFILLKSTGKLKERENWQL